MIRFKYTYFYDYVKNFAIHFGINLSALICQDVKVQGEITREFATRLVARDGSKIEVPDKYDDYKFPLHVLTRQAYDEERPWSDVDLVLRNLPARMAKDALKGFI